MRGDDCDCPVCSAGLKDIGFAVGSDEVLYTTISAQVSENGCAIYATDTIAYTIGLPIGRFRHPELVLLGGGAAAVGILFSIVKRIARERLQLSHQSMLVHRDTRLLFLDVAEHRKYHLEFCARYYQQASQPYDVLQLVWPDKNNRLPGEYGHVTEFDQSWASWDERSARAN